MAGRKQDAFQGLVAQLFREREKHPHLTVVLLRQHWPAILGAELAARTYPARLSRDTLWINAVDAGWAYQLQFMKADLLQSIQVFTESQAIRELRLRQGEVPWPVPEEEETAVDAAPPDEAPGAGKDAGPAKEAPEAGKAATPPGRAAAKAAAAGKGAGTPAPAGEKAETPAAGHAEAAAAQAAPAPEPAEAKPRQGDGEPEPSAEVDAIGDPSLRRSFARWRSGLRRKRSTPGTPPPGS